MNTKQPRTRICSKCKQPETEVKFYSTGNYCAQCMKNYRRTYKTENTHGDGLRADAYRMRQALRVLQQPHTAANLAEAIQMDANEIYKLLSKLKRSDYIEKLNTRPATWQAKERNTDE